LNRLLSTQSGPLFNVRFKLVEALFRTQLKLSNTCSEVLDFKVTLCLYGGEPFASEYCVLARSVFLRLQASDNLCVLCWRGCSWMGNMCIGALLQITNDVVVRSVGMGRSLMKTCLKHALFGEMHLVPSTLKHRFRLHEFAMGVHGAMHRMLNHGRFVSQRLMHMTMKFSGELHYLMSG